MNSPLPPAAALLADGQLEEAEGQWKNLPHELLINVVKCMQQQDRREGGKPSSNIVRAACQSWRRIFDAACTRLEPRPCPFPAAAVLCGLCGRLPALMVLDLRSWEFGLESDTEKAKVMQAVSCLRNLRELLFASAPAMTAEGLKSVAACTALTRLQLDNFDLRLKLKLHGEDDEGSDDAADELDVARAVGGLTALTSLNLAYWDFRATAIEAFSKLTALTELNLYTTSMSHSMTVGILRELSRLPALMDLNIANESLFPTLPQSSVDVLCNFFPTLSTLTIDLRTLSFEQRRSLQDARPNLNIVMLNIDDDDPLDYGFGMYEAYDDLINEGFDSELYEDYGYGMHKAYDDLDGYWDDEGTYHY